MEEEVITIHEVKNAVKKTSNGSRMWSGRRAYQEQRGDYDNSITHSVHKQWRQEKCLTTGGKLEYNWYIKEVGNAEKEIGNYR